MFASGVADVLGPNLHSLFMYGASFFLRPRTWSVDIDSHVDPRGSVPQPSWREVASDLDGQLRFVEEQAEYPKFGVLHLSRLSYSWRQRDVVISKYEAALWALEHLEDRWHDLSCAALRAYEQRPEAGDARLLSAQFPEFLAHSRQQIDELRGD